MTAEPKRLLDDEPTGRQEMMWATDALCGPAAGPGAVERGACVLRPTCEWATDCTDGFVAVHAGVAARISRREGKVMTGTPYDIGVHGLRLFGRSVSASRTREPELVTPPPSRVRARG